MKLLKEKNPSWTKEKLDKCISADLPFLLPVQTNQKNGKAETLMQDSVKTVTQALLKELDVDGDR